MYQQSHSNLQFDQRTIARLNQSIASIRALYNDHLLEVSLFGSYVKGEQTKFSSVDLLIVVDESNERFVKRNAVVQNLLNESDEIPLIDPLVYTEEEILDLLRKKESFMISVLKESIVVWNNFNPIDLSNLTPSIIMRSRYASSAPQLEEII